MTTKSKLLPGHVDFTLRLILAIYISDCDRVQLPESIVDRQCYLNMRNFKILHCKLYTSRQAFCLQICRLLSTGKNNKLFKTSLLALVAKALGACKCDKHEIVVRYCLYSEEHLSRRERLVGTLNSKQHTTNKI